MANERPAQHSDIKKLISKGLEQGYLTYAEVNDHLPDDMVDPEQIEDIIGLITGMGIDVHEVAPDADTLLLNDGSTGNREVDDTAAEEAAAVGHVDGRVLDRHPRRQRHHFRQRDVLVKAHAALARATADVVLHAVALEVGDGAVVQLDRHIDNQRALGALERLDPARERAQVGRDAVDLLQVDAPGAEVLGVQVGRQRVAGRCGGRGG